MEVFVLIAFAVIYACAHIGAVLARRRGRSPWLGIALGGVLGVVGLLILALMSDNPSTYDRTGRYRHTG